MWNKEDEKWLAINYPFKGKKFCMDFLNKTEGSIRSKSAQLKLKLNINSEFFKEFQSKASKSKVGKKRPEHSVIMKLYAKDGRFPVLTDKTKRENPKDISLRMKDWYKNNPHPKGFKNKKRTLDEKNIISLNSKKMWNDKNSKVNSKEHRQKISDRASILMEKRLKEKPETIYSRVKKGKVKIGDKEIYARSSWEANVASYFEFLKKQGQIKDWEHEPETFWFLEIKRGVRSYKPDFKITNNDGTYYFEEVKGWMDKKSKTKLNRMRIYYPKIKIFVLDEKRYKEISKNKSFIPQWGALS